MTIQIDLRDGALVIRTPRRLIVISAGDKEWISVDVHKHDQRQPTASPSEDPNVPSPPV